MTSRRRAGILVPLFSVPSSRSWGIGEIGDVPIFAEWLKSGGVGALQLLPVNEMGAGQTSPYSAISAMAIDPIYVSLADVRDFAALGGESRLELADQVALKAVRSSSRVDYESVRRVKDHALRLAFSWFWETEWVRGTARAGAFAAFCSWEEWWLADYGLYRALRDRFQGRSWTEWDDPLRDRQPAALEEARASLADEILYHQYVQWLADEQWELSRERSKGVMLLGDFPFMVSTDSADVWSRQDLFRFDATVGVPPDAFSATGQDWGLPVYRWDVLERDDYKWLRQRAKRSARLFEGFRVDHLVGFYRTYSRPLGRHEGSFAPEEEHDQLVQGERLMRLFLESNAYIIAEDLGSVPRFVRRSLLDLGIPGYKVFRWERDWDLEGQPFLDPATYPSCSVATTGTHDTDPLAVWWDTAPIDERRACLALPALAHFAADPAGAAQPFSPALRDAILRMLYEAPSELLLIPVPDLFGWTERINTPATVTSENWTWRLPWLVDRLAEQPEALERAAALRRMAEESGRA